MFTVAAISISGLFWFLIYAAVLVCFVWGCRWLAAKAGWTIPEPVWAILGFILLCFLALYLLGAIGDGRALFTR